MLRRGRISKIICSAAVWSLSVSAQTTDPIEALRLQIQELRVQLESSRRESQDLKRAVQQLREEINQLRSDAAGSGSAPVTGDQTAAIAEEQELTNSKLDEQNQIKVSSGSKYRLRLSGMMLLNVFSARGAVDNIDLPGVAQARAAGEPNGAFGASLRQSLVSLDVSGPVIAGARTSGSLNFDFFGGFPATPEGISAGLARLRTARLTLDWKNTSIVAGQEAPFFSPLSPSSLVATAYPALSSSGNLWTWTPQVYVEHRKTLSNESTVSFAWGILDPLTGDPPAGEYSRVATAGERSRIPAYAVRLGWIGEIAGRRAGLGAGGYYARQNWGVGGNGLGHNVDAWVSTADWDIPVARWFWLSGELYRGRAIAGLGGGASGSLLLSPDRVLPLESAGGWSQLKFKPLERIEFNTAFGEDYPFRRDLSRSFAGVSQVSRNASGFFNVIYQPRSNLLFSVEYRRLWTSRFFESKQTADHVSAGAGVIF